MSGPSWGLRRKLSGFEKSRPKWINITRLLKVRNLPVFELLGCIGFLFSRSCDISSTVQIWGQSLSPHVFLAIRNVMKGPNVTSLAQVRKCMCCRIRHFNYNSKSQRCFSILDVYCICKLTLTILCWSFLTLIDLVGIFLKWAISCSKRNVSQSVSSQRGQNSIFKPDIILGIKSILNFSQL